MRKSPVLLVILLLVLGLVLCILSTIVAFAVIQVVRSIGHVWVLPPIDSAAVRNVSGALVAAWSPH